MKLLKNILLGLLLSAAPMGHLAAGETKSVEVEENDIDSEITNEKLRADSGSKNRISFKGRFNYQGGSIVTPLGDERPNLFGDPGTKSFPSLRGTIGMQYRPNKNFSVALQTGVGINRPLSISYDDEFSDESFIENPVVTFSSVYKFGGLQNISSLSTKYFTDDFLTDRGFDLSTTLTHTLLMPVGKFSFAAIFAFTYTFRDEDAPIYVGDQNFREINTAIFPYMEYRLNKRYALRGLLGPLTFFKLTDAAADKDEWNQSVFHGSVGLGISVARDFYLYPNIQFLVEDIRNDFTNIALETTINF